MKKNFTLIALFIALFSKAQLLSWSPDFIQESSTPVSIIMDANYGNKGLYNYSNTSDVYVHIGVITNKSTSSSDWKHVPFTWATTNIAAKCTYLGNNKWQYTITGGLRTFFNITDVSESVLKIAILFRNGAGTIVQRNTSGNDMFIPVYDNTIHARIDDPFRQPEYIPINEVITKTKGNTIPIVAKASLTGSTIKIYYNDTLLSTLNGTKDSISKKITTYGTQTIVEKVYKSGVNVYDTFTFFVAPPTNIAALPKGAKDGINYLKGDTSVTLVLYAPNKTRILALGDFNNWTPSVNYMMNQTPDLQRFWITLSPLQKGTEYAYQYLIDDSIQVADYNSEKILDKYVDTQISATTYPNLKSFPAKAVGSLASVLQTKQSVYKWKSKKFVRPDKHNLVVYELLVRDFVNAKNWQTITDTLSYLQRLGVNAVEIMPLCNFEGYSSWGYNPNFFFAPDKVYGTPANLKRLIDSCHMRGMAVIMDLAIQDVFGSSPLAQMYWNKTLSIPAANNPWLDQYPTHAFNVGYQFNHSSAATIALRERVFAHWLKDYHVDGFRFDLAKGFTQTNTCDGTGNNCNVNAWSAYDAGRVNTWKNIYDTMQIIAPGSYCILEMFADNSEETVEANYGMLLWGNMNYNFTQATMGYSTGWDFSYGLYTSRGWSQPNLVTYQESHDEQRLMYQNEKYGNASGSYNIKDTATALKRNAMAASFWAMMPGPKMMWQFGELGYDFPIGLCSNGTIANCNTDPKPIRWDYKNNTNRLALYNVFSRLLKLKNIKSYSKTFTTGSVNKDLSGTIKWMSVYGDSIQVMVYGNFDVVQQTGNISFPSTGTWYNLFTGATKTVNTTSLQSVTLAPGEYYVYTNKNVPQSLPQQVQIAETMQQQQKQENGFAYKLFPNPATNNTGTAVYIQKNCAHINIVVTDISGKILYNYNKTSGAIAGEKINIPLQHFSKGVYILNIQTDKANSSQKIIVQ